MMHNRFAAQLRKTLLIGSLAALPMVSAAQSLVQVPFASVEAGIPASMYNGTTAASPVCSTALDALGNGCPPTQATIDGSYGAAIDPVGNIYIADYRNSEIRVIYLGDYPGNTVAAALLASNPAKTFTPTFGNIYSLAGTGAGLTAHSGLYYCTGTSGAQALDSSGDDCPGQYNEIVSRGVQVDSQGNVFFISIEGYEGVRVFYVQGSAAANLITAYNQGVNGIALVPQPGHIYALSNPVTQDFKSVRDVAIDSNENVYVSDNTLGEILKLSASGPFSTSASPWKVYLAGGGTATGVDGDGGPVGSASIAITTSEQMFLDQYNNLYISDYNDARVRVVYNSGTTPPLYVEGSNGTVVTSPVPGYIYTVAGGSSGRSTGTLASGLSVGGLASIGMDPAGNLYFEDSSKIIWRENAQTGIAVQLSTIGASTTSYSAATTAAAGVACNGSTGGPLMTDAYADGCPATEVYPYGTTGRMVFDSAGNFYQIEQRASTAASETSSILRKYTFNGQFGSVATGAKSTITLAYTPATTTAVTTSPIPTPTYAITGDATSEFVDGGNDLCGKTPTSTGTLTCTYNATFQPALAGARLGSLTLTSSATTLATTLIGGSGTGAQLSIDPATQTTIGGTLSPLGVGVDQGGNSYISDATSNNIYESVTGGTPTALTTTGLNKPAQLAVNGAGTIYVADTGNNRVAQVAKGGGTVTAFLTTYNSLALNDPQGVAVDQADDIFVSDTGNNRILEVSAAGAVLALGFSGLSTPLGLAIDAAGDIFVADSGNSRIVELTSAGVQKAITVSPALSRPVGVAVDPAGNLYVADAGNLNVVQIPIGSTTANVLLGDISGLTGIAADATGDLFLGISGYGELALNRTQITVAFPPTNVGSTVQQALTLGSTGTASLVTGSTLSSGTDTVDFSVASSTTNGCSTNQTLAPGASCGITATFQPKSKTTGLTDVVTFSSNAADSASATLTGNGVNEIATSTALTYTTTPGGLPLAGQSFTVTATITPASGSNETGSVTFAVDGTPMKTVPVVNGSASISLTLQAGTDTVTAVYSGDSNYAGSEASITFPVVTPQASSLSLAIVNGPAQNLVPFTLTATLTSMASQGAIGGTVSFYVDGSATPTVMPTSGNAASITLTLPTGNHTVVADYNGSPYYMSSMNSITFLTIPAGRSMTTVSVQSPIGTITYGQSVVIQAVTTTSNAVGPAMGNITFAVDGVAQTPIPYAATVTTTITPGGGAHTVTATYNGDNTYAPNTGTLMFTVARATPAITLNITPNVGINNNSFTLTSTVSSPVSTPTRSVTFSYGTTNPVPLGTANLSAGVATYTTTTNVQSSYVFNAAYIGDANFLPVTVSTTQSPTFVLTVPTATISVPQNAVGLLNVNLNSFYGYTGSVIFSCTGLPANAVCRGLNTPYVVATDSVTGAQVQIYTNVNQSAAVPHTSEPRNGGIAALAAALCLSMLPFWRRRRELRLLLPLLAFAASLGFSGCGSDTTSKLAYATPTGTYSIVVSATDGTTTATVPVTLTVLTGTYQ